MLIGSWGPDLVFEVSGKMAETFSELNRKSSARWAKHEPINSKPLSEFLGPDLDELEMTMTFSRMLGVDPMGSYEKLKGQVNRGEYHPMILGGKPLSGNFWYIEEITGKSEAFAAGTGNVLQMEVSVVIKEYN